MIFKNKGMYPRKIIYYIQKLKYGNWEFIANGRTSLKYNSTKNVIQSFLRILTLLLSLT